MVVLSSSVLTCRIPLEARKLLDEIAARNKAPPSTLAAEILLQGIQKMGNDDPESTPVLNGLKIERLVTKLKFLEEAQRKMLKHGSYLTTAYPRSTDRVRRWAMVRGIEKEALLRILGEREATAKQLAELIKETYPDRGFQFKVIDRRPHLTMGKLDDYAD